MTVNLVCYAHCSMFSQKWERNKEKNTGRRTPYELNELVWETAEELDKKLAERIRRIRKRRSISQQELELTDELRVLFAQVPYRSIEEVIHEG